MSKGMKKLAKASSHGSVFIVAVIVSLSFALYVSYGASGNPSASVAGQQVANNNAAGDNAALSAVTEMAVAPSVQILNNSFEAKEGVPLVVAFKVNSLANQKIDFAIATAGARLSTGLIEDNSISVPSSLSIKYPSPRSFVATNPTSGPLYVRLTFSSQGQVPLELVVFESLGTPGQAIGVVQNLNFTVTS